MPVYRVRYDDGSAAVIHSASNSAQALEIAERVKTKALITAMSAEEL